MVQNLVIDSGNFRGSYFNFQVVGPLDLKGLCSYPAGI